MRSVFSASGGPETTCRLPGANLARPVLLADDEPERGAVEVAAFHGLADVLAERAVGQVELEPEPALLVEEPQRAGLRPSEHLVRVVVQQCPHVAVEHVGERSGCDLLPVAAEVVREDVVDAGVADDRAAAALELDAIAKRWSLK